MTTHAALHHQAMAIVDEAELACRSGDVDRERTLLASALAFETGAASQVEPNLEPTRSVLYRSAASLAVQLGDSARAHALALEGLRGAPPRGVRAELFEILDALPSYEVPK